MAHEKGWKPLPISLKIFFVIYTISLVFSLLGLWSIYKITQLDDPIVRFQVHAILAIVLLFLLNIVASIILLVALWNRYAWGWKYGILYAGYFILDGVRAIISLPAKMEVVKSQVPAPQPVLEAAYFGALLGTGFNITLSILFLIVIYTKRDYFRGKSVKSILNIKRKIIIRLFLVLLGLIIFLLIVGVILGISMIQESSMTYTCLDGRIVDDADDCESILYKNRDNLIHGTNT